MTVMTGRAVGIQRSIWEFGVGGDSGSFKCRLPVKLLTYLGSNPQFLSLTGTV